MMKRSVRKAIPRWGLLMGVVGCLAVGIAYAEPSELEMGLVLFSIDEQVYQFENARAIVEDKSGQRKITIGLLDKGSNSRLLIRAEVQSLSQEQHLDIQYNSMSLMFQNPRLSFVLIPATQFIKNPKNRMERKSQFMKGEGIVQNKKLENTSFFLHLYPILEDEKLVELRGSFSGVIKVNDKQLGVTQTTTLNNGEFRVPVSQ